MLEPNESPEESRSSTEQQNFVQLMTDLLASPLVREEFTNEPEKLLARYNLTEPEKESLQGVEIKQLEDQAQTLVRKRWHALKKLIPKTIDSGSPEEIRSLFEFYATRNWPTDFRRHWIDAYEFILFLEVNELPFADPEEKQKLSGILRSS